MIYASGMAHDVDPQTAQLLNGRVSINSIGNWRRRNEPPSGHRSAKIDDLPRGTRKTTGARGVGDMVNRLTKKPGGNQTSSVLG